MKIQSQTARVTLKSFKTIKSMSEETVCFTANVYLDGKLIGEAANEGHGGCTFVHFVNADAKTLAESFAKPINPADVKGWEFLASEGFTFDCLVDIAVQSECKKKADAATIKRVKKDMLDKVVFVKAGECPKQGYRILRCGVAGIAAGIEQMKTKYADCVVFNGQSDEALASAFCL